MEDPGAERDRPCRSRTTSSVNSALPAAQRVADVDTGRLVRTAVLVEEAELCRDGANEREQDAEVQRQSESSCRCAADDAAVRDSPPRPPRGAPGVSSPHRSSTNQLENLRPLRLTSTPMRNCRARPCADRRRPRGSLGVAHRHLRLCGRAGSPCERRDESFWARLAGAQRATAGLRGDVTVLGPRRGGRESQHRHLGRPPQAQREARPCRARETYRCRPRSTTWPAR